MGKHMHVTRWVIFDNKGCKVGTKTIKHDDGRLYIKHEIFEKELKEKGLYAHRKESLDQDRLKGRSFKEKLEYLGWKFDSEGCLTGHSY